MVALCLYFICTISHKCIFLSAATGRRILILYFWTDVPCFAMLCKMGRSNLTQLLTCKDMQARHRVINMQLGIICIFLLSTPIFASLLSDQTTKPINLHGDGEQIGATYRLTHAYAELCFCSDSCCLPPCLFLVLSPSPRCYGYTN